MNLLVKKSTVIHHTRNVERVICHTVLSETAGRCSTQNIEPYTQSPINFSSACFIQYACNTVAHQFFQRMFHSVSSLHPAEGGKITYPMTTHDYVIRKHALPRWSIYWIRCVDRLADIMYAVYSVMYISTGGWQLYTTVTNTCITNDRRKQQFNILSCTDRRLAVVQ